MSDDNQIRIPFGAPVKCRRCKVDIKHGELAFRDGKGYLYCAEHNPKKKAGPSEYKRAQLNPIPRITDQEVRDRIEELRDADAAD